MIKPNTYIPLACSYNERGIDGYAATITNSLDQRKINSTYDVVQNGLTGKTTLYLTKRPGATVSDAVTFGVDTQTAHLAAIAPGLNSSAVGNSWIFVKSGNDINACSTATTTTIFTDSASTPSFVDRTAISAVDTLVLQTRTASAMRTWYSTAIATFTEITDSDFTGLTHRGKMEHLDGYALILESRNRIYNSDLNTLSVWRAGSFITKQIVQDYPVGLMRFGQQILAFGAETCEVFRNAGNPTGSPLQTVPSMFSRIGALVGQTGGHYYAHVGQRLYFCGFAFGGDNRAIYSYDGAKFEKVSSPQVDRIINGAALSSISHMCEIGISGKTALAIALSGASTTPQRWLMFFPDWKDWFEWTSTVIQPVNNGHFFLGAGTNAHKLHRFGTERWNDLGTGGAVDITMTHQFQLPRDGAHKKTMPMFGVIGDTARSASTLNVEFSDDDGQNWSAARGIDMTSQDKAFTRGGSYKERQVRLTHTGNTECRLEQAVATIR